MAGRFKSAHLGEAGFGLGVMLFGVFVAVLTTNIPIGPAYSAIGPRVFPWLISGALILIGALLLIEALTAREPAERPQVDWRAIALVGLGLAGQLLLMTWAGFIIASTVLFVAVAGAFGGRRLLANVLIGLALCTVTQIVFTWGLGLRLPAGIFAGLF
ncbi:MAG TPA: tripartite tricarboxylate transporter TctB family protein [Alphaproteobacteria bacterium]|nr:tripartite tricarboxylate transporter TctB family protein [Alphaproteobacteria bacterium]